MKGNFFLASLCGCALSVNQAFAASFFTDSFDTDPTATGGNLVLTSSVSGASGANLTGGNVSLSGGGDGNRFYYGTVDTDYSTVSFIATIDVQNNANNGAFFGLGPGVTEGNTGATFGEPSTGPAVYAIGGSSDFVGIFGSGSTSGIAQSFNQNTGSGGKITDLTDNAGTLTTLTLTYDATAQTATFTSSIGTAPVVVDTSGRGFDGTNSRIFFGGSDAVFDNLSITPVPEPSSVLLLSLGALGLIRRKR